MAPSFPRRAPLLRRPLPARALAVVAFALAKAGCGLTPASPPAIETNGQGTRGLDLAAIPPLDALGQSATIAQFVVRGDPSATLDPETAALVEGPVSDDALRKFRAKTPTAASRAHTVPALIFLSRPGELTLAPSRALADGQSYTLVVGSAGFRRAVTAAADDIVILRRSWPPPDQPSDGAGAVFCGAAALPAGIHAGATLPPDVELTLSPGVLGLRGDPRCVTLRAGGNSASWPVPPALVDEANQVIVRLDPTPLVVGPLPPSPPPLPCSAGQIPFAPGCLEPADDRALLRLPPVPLLLLLDPDGGPYVSSAGSLALRGLTPSTSQTVGGVFLDLQGQVTAASASITTLAPESHLVLNEVLLTPAGPKPRSQWIEVVNDGLVSGDLAGFTIGDSTGQSPLPSTLLEPGAFALLVSPDFFSAQDTAPAPTALLVPFTPWAKSGLSAKGAELVLRAPSGEAISRFLLGQKTKKAVSICRRRPDSPDEDSLSFVPALGGRPTPGEPNGLP